MFNSLSIIMKIGEMLIKHLFPESPSDQDKAQSVLETMEREGKLEEVKTHAQLLLQEAKSSDKWVSRARPTFLYIFYLLILLGPILGILNIFDGEIIHKIGNGVTLWFSSIPKILWEIFAGGYLGYLVTRSFDKWIK